jgi:PAS domain S-box-containing protein
MTTSIYWRTITPRAFERWDRKIGFGNRLEVQALQWGKYPVKAFNALSPGLNPRLERAEIIIEQRIAGLQQGEADYEIGFKQALARTATKFNIAFWFIAAAGASISLVHHQIDGMQLGWHDTIILGIPLFLALVAGHFIKNSYLKMKIAIQERNRSEEYFQSSLLRYQQLFYQAPIGFHNISPEGKILAVNEKWLEIMGYTSRQVIARSIFDFIVPEQRENALRRFEARKIGQAMPEITGDRQYVKADGARVQVATHNTDVRDSDGKLLYSQTSFLDLTELRAAQAEKSKGEIRQREMEAAALAINGLVHALSQKFTGLLGYADLLSLDSNDQKMTDEMGAISQEIQSYFQTFNTFRYGIGRKESIKIGEFSSKLFQRIRERHQAEHPQAELSVDARLGEIDCSAPALTVIMEKVLANAFESVAPGGKVTLAVQKRNSGDQPGLELIITDNGKGIAPEVQDKMFRPFFSTDPDAMAHQKGLSLALVQYTVHKLGGTIEVNSEVGQGTEFKIWLPL